MEKKLIRLTESDLHRIVKESIKTAFNGNGFLGGLRRAWNTAWNDPSEKNTEDLDTYIWGVGYVPRANTQYDIGIDKQLTGYDGKPLGLSGYNTKKDLKIKARDKKIRKFLLHLESAKKHLEAFLNGKYQEFPDFVMDSYDFVLDNAEELGFEDKARNLQNLYNRAMQKNKLTESDLHRIVREAVNNILGEDK